MKEGKVSYGYEILEVDVDLATDFKNFQAELQRLAHDGYKIAHIYGSLFFMEKKYVGESGETI